MANSPKNTGQDYLKKIFRYLLQGIIILAPIGITVYIVYWLFDKVDSILRPYLNIPGLGFVIIVVFIILVGWISSNFLMGSFIHFFDKWVERTPVIKFIYSSTKDFFEAFAGDKKRFGKAVLANVFAEDVWIVGFLTDEEMEKFEMGADKVAVYVPQAYNFAGQLYILPRSRVKKIESISSGDAMKYAVTGGVVELEEEKIHHKAEDRL
ncbi:DUF502 domain-containing protein [Terrimonas sp. NA20]|uniref:DUF502 domain-containing protein n=1 Tax=Terrimonas ginsenosidimutans TaxID=2908004 RepID=A0ABS9KNF2_9BACT|nr:DUF502 domain-containing protein [Terrimonas ginsenosidimutans]MCG2613857.1 DUF502 domain-containing protein [Terrimonas ginsenosidimutans]